jgi:hypothetical protein
MTAKPKEAYRKKAILLLLLKGYSSGPLFPEFLNQNRSFQIPCPISDPLNKKYFFYFSYQSRDIYFKGQHKQKRSAECYSTKRYGNHKPKKKSLFIENHISIKYNWLSKSKDCL